ncbi:hypothetical protein FRB96_008332 [Tulasnella sp. 330]|nr:hypothetical protein FRB96_008332 [Tulasnella sp. 330]KAG8884788.1 hypothetical protein FRB97_003309 [Tulasnella sp. 331]KAG8889887.1 hypothetical protein FRB98_002241 [Tulasnella sp. 332]
MVNAFAVLEILLLATVSLAAPSTGLTARLDRRREGRWSKPVNRIETAAATNSTGIRNEEITTNWAGAVYDSPAGTYKAVTGTFIVPVPTAASGKKRGSATAWVGIDGDTCGGAILQTGIDFNVEKDGVSYDAWYEWFPHPSHDFSGISISGGDSITLTVTATSPTSGTAVITNNTTGQTVSKFLTSKHALCGENVEWIVEDFEEGSSLVPFANFGTVTFTDGYAITQSGKTVTPDGAIIFEIQHKDVVLTSVTTDSNGLTVKYIG